MVNECHLPSNYIKPCAFYRILHQKLGYSYKKFTPIKQNTNTEESKKDRKNWVLDMIPYFLTKPEIIFIDETGFNLNSHKLYGWGEKNTRVSMELHAKSCNYSLIGCHNKIIIRFNDY
jgi:hypothetical protein